MAASLAHWFINVAITLPHIHGAQTLMIQKVTVMITPATVEFLLRHQAAIRFDKVAHLYAVSQHRVILLHILCIDPSCSFYYKQVFYWRMITLNDVKRGAKRSTGIMTFQKARRQWGWVELVWGGGRWRHLPCLSMRPRKLSHILAHPLFRADQTLLATMDLIIIPMSIFNMWHKYHSRSLSIPEQRCETEA